MQTNSNNGVGAGFILFCIFLVLKLTGNIGWSWWWVTAPLWISAALWVAIFAVIALVFALVAIFGRKKYKPRRRY